MRPLIFVPDADGKKRSLTDVGLGHLEQGAERDGRNGPNGEPGLMFFWLDPKNRDIHIDLEKQTWLPALAHGGDVGRYLVGIWNDNPPTERELLKPDHRKGAFVQLADKSRWLITRPKDLDRFPVPQQDGSLTWVVDEQFNALFTELERIKAERVVTEDESTRTFKFDDESDFFLLCEFLAINYRVTPEIVAHLRLLSDVAIRDFVAALFGFVLEAD